MINNCWLHEILTTTLLAIPIKLFYLVTQSICYAWQSISLNLMILCSFNHELNFINPKSDINSETLTKFSSPVDQLKSDSPDQNITKIWLITIKEKIREVI